MSGFTFQHIRLTALKAGLLACSATIPCTHVSLNDVHVTSAVGFTCDAGVLNATATDVKPHFCTSSNGQSLSIQ